MDEDKQINTREDEIIDYIRNVHPEHLQSGFCVTADFIKLVERINDSINDQVDDANVMTDQQASDVFNNLPPEIICRPLDSKTVEIIFDVYGKRAHAWFAEEYAQNDVSSALGLRNRGAAKYALERYEEAITDYTRSIELEPDESASFICRSRAFFKLDRLNEACADAAHAGEIMAKMNDRPEYYIHLAMIFEKYKKYDMVIDCIDKYLRHIKSLEFYCDEHGDLWALYDGLRSTSWCPTGNIIQIDNLDLAVEILYRIQNQFEAEDKQQKLLPFSTVDELRKELATTREKLNEAIKKMEVKYHA